MAARQGPFVPRPTVPTATATGRRWPGGAQYGRLRAERPRHAVANGCNEDDRRDEGSMPVPLPAANDEVLAPPDAVEAQFLARGVATAIAPTRWPDPAAVRPHVVHVPGNDRPRWRPGTTAHRPGLVGRGSSGGRTATLRRRSRARRMHHHLKALTRRVGRGSAPIRPADSTSRPW
jgi:hypothetical protein